MLQLIRKLFGTEHTGNTTPTSEMSDAELWDELLATVRPPRSKPLRSRLSDPQFANVHEWLKPPTDCPMAKAMMRSLIDVQRSNGWKQFAEITLLYEIGDESYDEPPESSVRGVGGLCHILERPGMICWRTNPDDPDEFQKIEITLNRG
ncbi:hypothetical protein [Aporhodopirellula aestuarii]|uniref:Uncharacterized protein n=1 Tax=Aporhodopirellula aestuarii TaxID=2950107 RepID=A0ABT0UBU8_9BACT|nr:hypothetical protein [Aporhodopirellula aestuarii]MCM2374494.1 hypothetical protein [Aporhodopirellula aestuarii]